MVDMTDHHGPAQEDGTERFILYPHRSLSPRGFVILMVFVSSVSFAAGMAFLLMGAWPVCGFFGLDVGLIYLAFRLNFRDGRMYETIDVSPERLTLTRVDQHGHKDVVDFNPYWARVRLLQTAPDGRTTVSLAAEGREVTFGHFLTDEEREALAQGLTEALLGARQWRPRSQGTS